MLKFAIMYSVKKSKTRGFFSFKLIYCQYFHLFIIYLYYLPTRVKWLNKQKENPLILDSYEGWIENE